MSRVETESKLQRQRRGKAKFKKRHGKFPAPARTLTSRNNAQPTPVPAATKLPRMAPPAPRQTATVPRLAPAKAVPLSPVEAAPEPPAHTDPEPPTNDDALAADLALPIEELDLTVRSYNVLKRREGVNSIGELVAGTEAELLGYRNLGQKSIDEIKMKLAGMGLALKGDENAAAEAA